MVELTRGNIFEADAEALVNTVNCVASWAKHRAPVQKAYPANYEAYHKACDNGEVQPGRMFILRVGVHAESEICHNFPQSVMAGEVRYEDVESGLKALISEVRRLGIRSIRSARRWDAALDGLDGGR